MIEDAQWQHSDDVFKNGLRLAMMNNGYLAGIHKDLEQNIDRLIVLIDNDIQK